MSKPPDDRVIIEVVKEKEKTVGGIVLVSTAKEKPQTGTVATVGEGCLLKNGEKAPAAVKADDQVMLKEYAGAETKYEGKEYPIVAGKNIMAIVE